MRACAIQVITNYISIWLIFSVAVPESVKRCNMKCRRVYDPVCASNSITYDNVCVMQQDACFKKKTFKKVANGKCKQKVQTYSVDNEV